MVLGFLDRHFLRKLHLGTGQHDATSRKGSGKPPSDGSETDFSSETQPSTAANSTTIPTNFPSRESFSSAENMAEDEQVIQETTNKIAGTIFYPIFCVVLLSWGLGVVGASWAWVVAAMGVSWALLRGTIDRATEDFVRFESLRLHRRRALQSDETCEWLNLLLNRWWVFSSDAIFDSLRNMLNPRLQEAKPAFVEAISLKQLTLGDQTPLLRSVRCWDSNAPFRPSCAFHTPSGLALAPTHTLALLCDLSLNSESFSTILAARIGHKGMGVDLDVGVEHLVVEGRVLVTLFLDSEAPFPHVARLTFCFTERPKVSFRVKILKSVQMMEVPVLKTWLHNLVTDALATAWVDPGQLEVNFHTNEAFVPEKRPGEALALGVLTVTLRLQRGLTGSGLSTDEDKWIVVGVGGKTHISPPLRTPLWQYTCSFLLLTPLLTTNLSLKVKTKRLITSTLTQYDLPLSQYGLDACRVAETFLQKKGAKVIGGSVPPLHVRMEYTPIFPINLDAQVPTPTDQNNNGAGVLYIVVHGADNVVSAEASSTTPYCLVFNSRIKIKTTHYVSGSTSPRWDCGVEVLVPDVASVCITFVVCSLPRNPKLQDGELLGIHTLNLSTVQLPLIQKQLQLSRNLSTPTPGDVSPSSSSLTASIVFRCVPSVAGCNTFPPDNPNYKGMPLPMPFHSMGSPAGSSSLTNSVPNIEASITPPYLTPTTYPSLRRGSTGIMETDELILKKKSNSHWLHHAKHFLGSGHDNDGVRHQDLGDILASGLGLIELTIIRARDLMAKDLNGFSDPYCVVKVNGEVKYRTRVKKKTLDPTWNEVLMTHLPKKDQHVMLTLWDHDAFGMKDFLGSVTFNEEQVRSFSSSGIPFWSNLEGTKSGSLELKIKLISEDFQFETGSRCTSSISNIEIAKKSSLEYIEDISSRESSLDSDSGKEYAEKIKQQSLPYTDTNINGFKLSLPNRNHSTFRGKDRMNEMHSNSLLRASSNPSLSQCHSKSKECVQEENKMRLSRIDSICTPSRKRKSGAEILASALALAKAESNESLSSLSEGKEAKNRSNKIVIHNKSATTSPQINGSTTSTHPPHIKMESKYELESIHPILEFQTSQKDFKSNHNSADETKDVPKISLNDQSEDEYGLSEGSGEECIDSSKPATKVKGKRLKAMKEKLRLFRRK